jgi:hypothetical protein
MGTGSTILQLPEVPKFNASGNITKVVYTATEYEDSTET